MGSDKEDRITESLMLQSVASHGVQVFLDCAESLDSSNFGFGQACKRGFMKYGQASPTENLSKKRGMI